MPQNDRTYEDGLRDGRIEALEGEVGTLRQEMREGFEKMGATVSTAVASLGEAIRDEFKPVCEIVRGNGDAKKGLVSRLATLEETVSAHRWLIGMIVVALIGNVVATAVF